MTGVSHTNTRSLLVREKMVRELAMDNQWIGYEHNPDEIARVVAGLAGAARIPPVEYVAEPHDVAAVAGLVAFHLGVSDFDGVAALASELYLADAQPKKQSV